MPAAAAAPPVTWNVLPLATFTGAPLNGPQNPRTAAELVRSKLDTAVGDPDATNDWVVNGTPITVGVPVPVHTPSDVHPPAVYP